MRTVLSVINYNGTTDKQTCTIILKHDTENPEFDIKSAIKAAVSEFLSTGLTELDCDNFTYGDFVDYVPKNICEKHGFTIEATILSDICVDDNKNMLP